MKSLKKLFKYLIPYKKWLLLAPLFLVLELVMDIFLPAIFGNIINIGVVNNDTNYIIYNIVLMLVLTISGLVGGIFSVYYSAKASEFAANDLRKELFSKITSLNLLDLKKYENGHFITTLTTDINLIANIIMISIRIFFRVPIIVIGSLIMAIIISPKLSLILVAVTPLLGIITAILIKFVFPKFLEIQDGIDEVNSKVREDINGIKTLKSLTKEEEEKKNFDKVNLKLKNTGIKANRFLSLQVPLTTLLVDICIILVLYYGGKSILDGTYESLGISIGTILAFIQYLTNILFALIQASAVIVMLSKSEVSALRINEILEIKTKRRKKAIPEKITSITFDKVCFNYGGKNILDNISFKINKGEIIGITGFTGSGKSTIVSLLEESFEPSSGEILINDYKYS
jgi:ATP-binding cassette subfamily B protein